MKLKKIDQSRVPHFEMPMIDGVLREPLKKLTIKDTVIITIASKCFLHCFK